MTILLRCGRKIVSNTPKSSGRLVFDTHTHANTVVKRVKKEESITLCWNGKKNESLEPYRFDIGSIDACFDVHVTALSNIIK